MTRRFRLASLGCRAFAGALALVPLATHAQASPHYRIAHELPLPAAARGARPAAGSGSSGLDGEPGCAGAHGKGRIYVNLEDKSSVAVIDPRTLSVISVWPISGCQEPSGLALDAAGGHLFPVCANKVMTVMDAASGKVLGSAPIGGGVDAAAFDPGSRLAFASCGEGVLTVVSTRAAE